LPTTTKAFFPIVINYKFVANIDKNVMLTEFNNATQSNFSFEMNLKCLQFDTKRITKKIIMLCDRKLSLDKSFISMIYVKVIGKIHITQKYHRIMK
jgi:hypothetical protein